MLDWELCTLGDPLADVGLMLVYWTEAGDAVQTGLPTATDARRLPDAGPSWSSSYAERSGRDLSAHRLLRRPRLLEAGLHPAGGPRPLPCRGHGRPGRDSGRVLRPGGRAGPGRHGRPRRRASGRSVPELYRIHDAPELVDPVLVIGLDGWIDAGYAAANAVGTMLEGSGYVTVATFDADVLLDHRSRRPDDAHPRRRHHRAHVADDRAAGRGRRRRQRGAVPRRRRARPPVGRVLDRGGRPRPRVRREPGRVARRLSRRGAPHPPRAGGGHRHLGRGGQPHRHRRRAASTCPPASTPPSRSPPPRAACPPSASGPRFRTTRRRCPTRRPPRPW